MALFRRKANSVPAEESVEQTTATEVAETNETPQSGPYDVSELTDLGERLDLGAILLPGKEGLELRLEVDQRSGRITGYGTQWFCSPVASICCP